MPTYTCTYIYLHLPTYLHKVPVSAPLNLPFYELYGWLPHCYDPMIFDAFILILIDSNSEESKQ